MKPLNLDNSPCSPISSNCVIWQGPDIPCIKLCTGDTVSDVVFKLATELCTIIDQLNVSNYDLSCFASSACPPADFQALIQYLINQICTSQGITVDTTKSVSGCPDCLIEVASCFVQPGVATMQLIDYVKMIANKICSLVFEIAAINASITNLDIRVTSLESTPPPTLTLPSIPVDCTLSSTIIAPGSYVIDQVLNALINDNTYGYCALKAATGEPVAITSAVLSQCIADTDLSLEFGTQFQVAYAGTWITAASLNTAADAINNLWVAVCDIYNYVSNYSVTVDNTATINLDNTGNVITANITDTGWVDLNGFAYYSGVTKPQCRRIGNQIHFRGNVYIPLQNPSVPGAVVTLTSASTYNSIAGCTTWSGVGGCTIDSNGAIQFNNGGAVIPASVAVANLDGQYSLGWIVATRGIDVDPTFGTALTSAINVSITSTKGLTVQLVHDIEITTTRGSGIQGNSPLRLITSNVRLGEYLPNYIAAATDIHNAPSNANFPLVSSTFNLTWPFSCDAGNENQIGGFQFKLDGLVGYLDPCNTETGFSTVCP